MKKKQMLSKAQQEINEIRRKSGVKLAPWKGFYHKNGGAANQVTNLDLFHGTTVQVCGLYPFSAGSASPLIGVPVGHNIYTGATVCCDPISWFARAKLINNPSCFIFGNPGLGKSTYVRRQLIGLCAQGIQPLVLGDLRPDYVDVVRKLEGQVISLQEGVSHLNILDPGDATSGIKIIRKAIELATVQGNDEQVKRLENAIHEIYETTKGYQKNTLFSIITLLRGTEPSIVEGNVIAAALSELNDKFKTSTTPPILKDLYELIVKPTKKIRAAAMDRNEDERYKDATEELQAALMSLIEGGRFGTIFSKQTSEPMKIDKPVVFDISKLNTQDKTMRAAVLMACWTTGFGTVQIAKLLAELGLEEQRHYFIVMDEMHQALGAGSGMVDRIDYLTRLNRAEGVGQAMITHTPKDLFALPTEEDRQKASGLVERSGLKVLGGLSKQDLDMLDKIIDLSQTEKDLVNSWQSPAGFSENASPPGRGNFLIKIGGKPGIPVHVRLTKTEMEGGVHATSSMWEHLDK
ncbi:MAG: ATPase [Candidatus Ancillula sp.]|jgi:hypothetical protein|nr:ATPase [Candidatus Ancillula sp.]